ncbi:hypothetical protein, partial [Anaerovibrio slackiae]|uniref:hypothetical protein n=1 Tax=Anaerovibrio slackiae TaxID=2652309 RepID=UPI00386941AE
IYNKIKEIHESPLTAPLWGIRCCSCCPLFENEKILNFLLQEKGFFRFMAKVTYRLLLTKSAGDFGGESSGNGGR